MTTIRLCRDDERVTILAIVNAVAKAHSGVIPADRWHEPYMPRDDSITRSAYQEDGKLLGVMGSWSPTPALRWPNEPPRVHHAARGAAAWSWRRLKFKSRVM
jgi:hypothetical protein